MRPPTGLSDALCAYECALQDWDGHVATQSATEAQGLTVLRSRAVLQIWIASAPPPGVYTLQRLQHLDQRLRQQASALSTVIDFPAYRQSLAPPAEQWWWQLDRPDRYDWRYRGAGILVWTISLGLLGDLSRRVFLGGPGVAGVSAIAISGLLTLLNARSELTAAGREGFEQLLERLGVPEPWREAAKLGASGLLALGLLGFWLLLPGLSGLYNHWGNQAVTAGRLGSGEQNYQRAIALHPDNGDAHYNLGVVYEDLQQLEAAETHYRIAMQGEAPQAYNNLGRLLLQPPDADPGAAVEVLTRGLEHAKNQEAALKADDSFYSTQYSLYKNLGWARLQQGRYSEAVFPLQAAIGLLQRPEAKAEIPNPAAAHCLFAQVLEPQGDDAAILSWEACYQLSRPSNPEEDAWRFQACQRLKEETLSCAHP